MSVRVFLDHGEAYQNLGDEAMLRAAVSKFRERYPECTIIIPATSPSLLPAQLPEDIETVPSVNRHFSALSPLYRLQLQSSMTWRPPDMTKLIDGFFDWSSSAFPSVFRAQSELSAAIQSADVFYGVGGAYFNDFYPMGLGYKRWMYRQVTPETASALSAQGFGPLERPWSRTVTKEAISNLDVVTFRDCAYSEQVIGELCPDVEQRIVGDEAFEFSRGSTEAIDSYLEFTDVDPEDEFIAFHYRGTDYTQDTSEFVERLAAVIDRLVDELEIPVVFVPMSYGTHSGDDRQYGKLIAEEVNTDLFHVGPECRDAGIVKGVVGRASLAVGLSYHFHVFALSQAVPSVVLYSGEYYRLKSEGLFGFYSLEEYILNVENTPITEVAETCSDATSSHLESRIKRGNETLRGQTSWTAERMLELAQQ